MTPEDPWTWLRSLLQEALWRWPEDAAAARALWQQLVEAAVAARAANPTGAELDEWIGRVEGQRSDDESERAVLLARGMRLLAMAAADQPPPKRPARRAPPPAEHGAGPTPEDALTQLRGCGPRTAERLGARGIQTVADLLGLLPLHYEDRRHLTPIGALSEGRPACTTGTVARLGWLGRGRRRFFELALVDGDDKLLCRWFRTYPGLSQRFAEGMRLWVSGTPRPWRGVMQMAHPVVREQDDDSEDGGEAIVPRYPTVEGVGPTLLRSLCAQACERALPLEPDPIPASLRRELGLPGRAEALRQLHQPSPELDQDAVEALEAKRSPAHLRLVFDELFLLQLGLARRRREVRALTAPPCPLARPLADRLADVFPFTLTGAQQRVIAEISADLSRAEPMHRLVQGDVGSGKTAVAFAAAAQVMAGGGQVALMAPTEILAQQHHETLAPWMKRLGHRLAVLTASTPRGARESTLSLLGAGQLHLVVGTHALLAERVAFQRLALVIVDEQHRFGVAQRARLRDKGQSTDESPHLLVMTATPIPRTLALTAYGDLDSSVIDELPAGRRAPETHVFTARQRPKLYRRVKALLGAGQRAFVICPLVEESETLELADTQRTHAELTELMAPHPVGLLHGRMPTDDKTRTLDAFRRGELSMLVATTVVEVGVDIPDADIMVVESAQRFGLAQLHQLRGRVGRRADAEARCLLLADTGISAEARQRLAVMEATCDGFRIAEEDLAIRGPGELLGLRQAGASALGLATAAANPRLLSAARETARLMVRDDPALEHPDHRAARALLETRWAGRLFGEEAG